MANHHATAGKRVGDRAAKSLGNALKTGQAK